MRVLRVVAVREPVQAGGAVQERSVPLTERIKEAIGLKTHQPAAEVSHICSCITRRCAEQCVPCQHHCAVQSMLQWLHGTSLRQLQTQGISQFA